MPLFHLLKEIFKGDNKPQSIFATPPSSNTPAGGLDQGFSGVHLLPSYLGTGYKCRFLRTPPPPHTTSGTVVSVLRNLHLNELTSELVPAHV